MKSRSNSPFASPRPVASPRSIPGRILGFHSYEPTGPDYTSFLSDEILLQVFRKVPVSHYVSNSLVCKRWLFIHGRLVQSIKVMDFGFVNSGRAFTRFPNLENIDIAHACIKMPRNSGILIARNNLSVYVGAKLLSDGFIEERDLLLSDLIDNGLELISKWYPNLRRIVVFGSSENGLLCVSSKCKMLQELELHCCGDMSLMGISGCRNLQVLKLIGCVDGFYNSVVSDIGLTILAQGCRRLVKLELCGCEGSYDGIKAIGQCCQMLEELTIKDQRMDGGWLAALSFCENLKTLRLQSCKSIDSSPGLLEHLGSCPTLEELHLQQCQLRDKQAVKALFLICKTVREIVLQNCWGLEDEAFASATVCRLEFLKNKREKGLRKQKEKKARTRHAENEGDRGEVQGMHSDVTSLRKASIWQEASRVINEEGFRAFWKGNLVTIAHRLPYSSLSFFAYERYKSFLQPVFGVENHRANGTADVAVHFIGGGMARITAASATYPLDLVRTRIAALRNTMYYRGIWHAFHTICKEEGFLGLYKGLGATLPGVGPSIVISFSVYESLRSFWHSKRPNDSTVMVSLACGSLSGIASSTATFPLDLVRRRMQLEGASGRAPVYTSGLFGTFANIIRTEGFRGMYRGILPEYYKVVPSVGIVFMTYETLKMLLSLILAS